MFKSFFLYLNPFARRNKSLASRSKHAVQNDKIHPTSTMTFEEWFKRQKFRNFKFYELQNYFHAEFEGVYNSPPPRELWANIVPILRVADDVRDELGVPVVITSSYRDDNYNFAVGGVKDSQHKQFKALDIVVAGHTPKVVFKHLRKLRDKGAFTGGLGLYATFTHLDDRGENATW